MDPKQAGSKDPEGVFYGTKGKDMGHLLAFSCPSPLAPHSCSWIGLAMTRKLSLFMVCARGSSLAGCDEMGGESQEPHVRLVAVTDELCMPWQKELYLPGFIS
jgi:hypothetical protein